MRRLLLLPLVALAGCGTTTTVTKPPNLGPPRGEAHDIQTLRTYKPKRGNAEQANYYSASGCGVERWAVKVATDPGANQINLTPQASSIADIVSIAPPVGPTDRVGPFETSTFRISGMLKFAKREADGDYHLGIEDAAGNTMIAESADPRCATGSVVLPQIEAVRRQIDERFPQVAGGQVVEPGLPVVLTGIGFMDRIHGQSYVAKNGAELHPLVAIQFG